MSGKSKRNYPKNSLDVGIVKTSIREHIRDTVGLSTLSWDEAKEIIDQVTADISTELDEWETFDDYWCGTNK